MEELMATDTVIKQLAQYYYRKLRLEPQAIADKLELSVKNIYRWIREENWDVNRIVEDLSPNVMAVRLISHINMIEKEAREDNRHLSLDETKQIKMITEVVERISKKTVFFANALEALEMFSNDLRSRDANLHRSIKPHMISFAKKLAEQQATPGQ